MSLMQTYLRALIPMTNSNRVWCYLFDWEMRLPFADATQVHITIREKQSRKCMRLLQMYLQHLRAILPIITLRKAYDTVLSHALSGTTSVIIVDIVFLRCKFYIVCRERVATLNRSFFLSLWPQVWLTNDRNIAERLRARRFSVRFRCK